MRRATMAQAGREGKILGGVRGLCLGTLNFPAFAGPPNSPPPTARAHTAGPRRRAAKSSTPKPHLVQFDGVTLGANEATLYACAIRVSYGCPRVSRSNVLRIDDVLDLMGVRRDQTFVAHVRNKTRAPSRVVCF